MSKLKVQSTCVTTQYINTYLPNRRLIKHRNFLLWAETSKGWFRFKKATDDRELAAKVEAKIVGKGTINTTHWEAVE